MLALCARDLAPSHVWYEWGCPLHTGNLKRLTEPLPHQATNSSMASILAANAGGFLLACFKKGSANSSLSRQNYVENQNCHGSKGRCASSLVADTATLYK